MGWRIKTKGGDEWDLCSKWRKRGFLGAWPGRWKKVKRRIVRRERQNARKAARINKRVCYDKLYYL